MAFKSYVPTPQGHWEEYWDKTTIEKNLIDCDTDGLLPVFQRYLTKDQKILEAGCGLGKWVIYFSKRGYDIFGVDSYLKAIQALKKYDSTLKVSQDKVEKLSFTDNFFDVYLSFGVVEHFEEGPQKALLEAYRILKNDGVAVIETPYDNYGRILKRTVGRLLGHPKPSGYFYEYRYTDEELKNFVEQAGFKILGVRPKDDLSPDRSIGLWLDYPVLRAKNAPNFHLNTLGKLIKLLLSPFPSFWSACIVVIARKE